MLPCEACLNTPICKYRGYMGYMEGRIRNAFNAIVEDGRSVYQGTTPPDVILDLVITCKYHRPLPVQKGEDE